MSSLVHLVLRAACRLGVDDTYQTGRNARASGGRFDRWSLRNRVDSGTRGLRIKFNGDSKIVDMQTAALWLLVLGMPEVAVTCPECLARGSRWDSETIACDGIQKAERYATSKRAAGWHVIDGQDHDGRTRIVCSRPCPTCTVTPEPTPMDDGRQRTTDERVVAWMADVRNREPIGRVMREPARVLLEAMPQEALCQRPGGMYHGIPSAWLLGGDLKQDPARPVSNFMRGDVSMWFRPGDPASIDAIVVLADQLQAIGDQRGEWLALWLAGESTFAHALPEVAAALRVVDCPRDDPAHAGEAGDHERAGSF